MQAQRLGGSVGLSFTNILDRDDIEVADDPSALAPERALVLEVIGSPERFVNAANKVGLEWLAEEVAVLRGVRSYFDPEGSVQDGDEEDDEDGDGADDGQHADDEVIGNRDDDDDAMSGALYLGMPTKATFELLRDLWDKFRADQSPPDKYGDWWKLFGLLHQLRPWGPEDRIGDATRRRLKEEQGRRQGDDLTIEVDLWYRGDATRRGRAVTEFRELVAALGGEVLDEERIDEIRYHAALVHLPGPAVDAVIARSGPLATADDVMSIRPQNGFRFTIDELVQEEVEEEGVPADPTRVSIGALLDGWPVENHVKLRNRLDVIDLEVSDSMAPVNRRFHGTAMASLILRGDLHEGNPPLDRRLKVVPVLAPDGPYETPPKDKLAIGVIHRAVRELKEGTGGQEPSGPNVVVINHSICDEAFGFAGTMSAWARLLDHLSWKYRVLFVISAGNIRDTFDVAGYKTGADMRKATPEHRRAEMLRSLDAAKSLRTIFAPADSVNALTVAAGHADGSTLALPPNLTDPFGAVAAPILGSGLGHGFNRSVKPDVMLPGGRQVAHPTEGPTLQVHGREHPDRFGQSVASPDPNGGHLDFTRRSAGTSNAAALATRMGMLIGDVLDDSPVNAERPWYERPTAPCILKALIAHGASWGDLGQEMTDVHIPSGHVSRRKEAVSRAMGYGMVDPSRVVNGGGHRVTLLAEDQIRKEQRHEWRIPLPDDMRSSVEFRRIVVTLAWLTPVSPNSSQYRTVALDLVGDTGKTQLWEGIKRVPHQPAVGFARRGTLIHAVYEGNRRAIPFGPDGDFVINIQATSKMPGMSRVDVPYAMAVTIEVADSINADIATSIRRRVTNQARTRG